MDNIGELNDLINAGVKLASNEFAISLKNQNRKTKPGWEMRLEEQIKKLQKQVRRTKKRKTHKNIMKRKDRKKLKTTTTTTTKKQQKTKTKNCWQDWQYNWKK